MSVDANRARILLVDDEPNVLSTTAAVLSQDHDVLTAGSAEAALGQLAESSVDVLCTDYSMPGMNGLELLRRAVDAKQARAGVVITGYREFADRDRSAVPSDYLVVIKPYDPERLLDVVEQAVRLARLRKSIDRLGGAVGTLGSGNRR